MKFSLMTYTFARQAKIQDAAFVCELFRYAVELKMDGIDMVTTYGVPACELRKMAADCGIPIVAHTFFADLNHTEAAERQAGVDCAKRGLDDAVAMGAPVVMVVTPGKAELSPADSRRNWIAGLGEVMPFAKAAGITLTIENFPGATSPFVTSADVFAATKILPDLKLTFDNGNCETGGEPAAVSFKRSRDLVVHAHFKDWDRFPGTSAEGMAGGDGNRYRPALIGEGVIDHRSCIQAMREAGYKGCINIEYENNKYNALDANRRALAFLRSL